jgi:hypothetical protein
VGLPSPERALIGLPVDELPTPAATLAEEAGSIDGLVFNGVMGYEGHCVHEPDATERARKTHAAIDRLLEAVEAIRSAGIAIGTVSAGGTGTLDTTGAIEEVTELRDNESEEIPPRRRRRTRHRAMADRSTLSARVTR